MVSLIKKKTSAMEGISLRSVQVLVALIADSARVELDLIERRFEERARGFGPTLNFLEGLGALVQKGREVVRSAKLDEMQKILIKGDHIFFEYLVKISIVSRTRYGRELREVLQTFKFKKGLAILRIEELKREYYAARNVLLEAGAIKLDRDSGTYAINAWFHREFVKARYAHGVTPDHLTNIIAENLQIGLAAELKIVEYEREAVGRRDAANVIHISLENTSAGFDIASVRRDEETYQQIFRMIEVKAVSPQDWAFTFTRNEIHVASDFRNIYFLYLVPVVNGEPTTTDMKVIQNPMQELRNRDEWTIETGEWVVSRTVRNG